MESISLLELNQFIQQSIELNFESDLWVECELSNLKASRGNYYVDLVQKSDSSDRIVAKSSAVIWKANAQFIQEERKISFSDLENAGADVRLKVKVDFHIIYGLKCTILDIDPRYTLGQLELLKKQTIERLDTEGLFEQNSSFLSDLPYQRLAIISGEHAAGYQDFIQELRNNSYGYHFDCHLFPCALQGERVLSEFLKVNRTIQKRKCQFDAIVLIRGGGSKLDLSAFDQYELAKEIAHSTLPYFTGIGHEIDRSVADMVSAESLKTPTAVAHYFVNHLAQYENRLIEKVSQTVERCQTILQQEKFRMQSLKSELTHRVTQNLERGNHGLGQIKMQYTYKINDLLRQKENELVLVAERLNSADPEHILKRGFVLLEQDGTRLTKARNYKENSELVIHFQDGKVTRK